ncbi:Oxysterol-binding protein-related protein [Drosera capensis]
MVRINDIIGNGISGVLYKWVNYGKGWRPRWFVLHDGVLSYYKIHGPDKIVVSVETEKGCKVIGEESVRRIGKSRSSSNGSETSAMRRKPFGEIHLKVSSIRESRSDDKRFSIFTGTKRLHLRAETREDRAAWMDALQAVKDMFPRMSNSELMAPMDNLAVSTEKLRQRLQEEGVPESAIQDSELIMRSEFAALQKQLLLLKQKQWQLIDTLRQLETEVVDLENTVVDESQKQGSASRSKQEKYSEASASGSDDDNDRVYAAEEETDDDETPFFDTRDFMSSTSFRSNGSDVKISSVSSEDEGLNNVESEDEIDPSIKSVGASFPSVKRRKKLPDPVETEKGVSLWQMIKDNIGKDLTKVCLPVYFNEPFLSLQKCFKDLEYSYLLDRANEWGKRGNSLMRVLNVAAFAVSGYASTEGRICKPFNPLLVETYEADYPDKGLCFFSEKVQGTVQDKNGKSVATVFGKWDESVHYVGGDCQAKGKGQEATSMAHLLWRRSKPPKYPTRYNFTQCAISLNELTPGLKEKLPPTDSRLRPDQRYLENGEYEKANAEKLGKCKRVVGSLDGLRRINKLIHIDTLVALQEGDWESCPDIFGQIPSLESTQPMCRKVNILPEVTLQKIN